MHPALSVIFFTAVSGIGYGLLFLLGLTVAVDPHALVRNQQLVVLAAGAALTAAGLMSSMLHLGRPLRAWRAFSQWRSSWLSREGVAAVLTFVPLLWLGVAAVSGGGERAAALTLAALAGVTVCCTAKIYTSLKTIHAWHNAYVLPGYALFALLGGAAALWIAATLQNPAEGLAPIMPPVVAVLGALAAVLKRSYWVFIDTQPAGSTVESATGLGRFGSVRSFEAPHTQANYLTREMGFALARKHAARLRVIAVVLFAVVPLICAAVALLSNPALTFAAAVLATAGIVAGTFVERWLFFAEAKHVVMLYYER